MSDFMKEDFVVGSSAGILRKLSRNHKYRDLNLKRGDRAVVTIQIIKRFNDEAD